jgi:hypothetical protein
MSDIQPLAPEFEALALAELAKRVAKVKDATKAEFSQHYPDGRKETFRSPVDGVKLGQVYRTDPDPAPIVTDREALVRHLTTIPGCTETVVEIAGSDEQVVEVLAEHAPHLLAEVTRVPDHVVANVLAGCKAKGTATGPDGKPLPGVAMDKPGGILTVKPDKDAGRALEGMVKAGLLTWDGRRAITAGTERAAS